MIYNISLCCYQFDEYAADDTFFFRTRRKRLKYGYDNNMMMMMPIIGFCYDTQAVLTFYFTIS